MNTKPQQRLEKGYLLIDHKKQTKISIQEIIYLQGDINYTNFIFRNRRQITISHSLKYFEEALLKNGFLRIHRSHIVNSKFIKTTNLDEMMVVLMDGRELKVARRRVKMLDNM